MFMSAYCEHARPLNCTKWLVSSNYLFLRNSRQQRLESNAHIERDLIKPARSDVNLTTVLLSDSHEHVRSSDLLRLEDDEIGPSHGMPNKHVTLIRSLLHDPTVHGS
ncbi:hypothetical protein SEVIR_6G164150v4 [Setaria viridis]|uniref:Uncharacterized protein n=1 Tax=Setaria viridis TaxID=4556 RepID=A0A4U6U4B2_SETVI|nr:hypothetical protein SEVIR_6G164150v2 [Setaria viridis]